MRILRLGFLLLLTGCYQAGLAVVNAPDAFADVNIVHDISYGPNAEQKLDIYTPAVEAQKPRDVIVFFYGGRWSFGEKEDYEFAGDALAKAGYIVVIPNYRKYPEVHFPVFVQDGAKALSWVYDNIENYHGQRNHIHVAGHSAGAHIGALLTADAHYLAYEGKKRSVVIHDFAGLAGPYAFTPDEPDLEDMFGPPEKYPLMHAVTFIDGKQPPMLLMHGADDTTVKPENLERLQQSIKAKGGYVKSILYPDTDHISILLGLSWLMSDDAPVVADMTTFFNSTNTK